MRSSNLPTFCKVPAFVLVFCALCAATASAQSAGASNPRQMPPVNTKERRPAPVARASETADRSVTGVNGKLRTVATRRASSQR